MTHPPLARPMGFSLVTPSTVEEALRELAAPGPEPTAVLAGGSDLLLDLEAGRRRAGRLLSLRRLPWNRLRWEGDSLVIGSTAPLRALELDEAVRRKLPGLWEGVRAVGGVALRLRATVGGNLGRASPASDLIPILLAYEAVVHLVGPSGPRDAALADFVGSSRSPAIARGELIESVTVPFAAPSAYVWQRVRPANDISQVGVAAVGGTHDGRWRLALGGVTPGAQRLPGAEAHLAEPRPTPEAIDRAAREASEHAPFLDDKRATEPYRRRLAGVLVRRAVDLVLRRSPQEGVP